MEFSYRLVDGISRLCMPLWSIVLYMMVLGSLSGIAFDADVIGCILLGENMFYCMGVLFGSLFVLLTCSSISWYDSLWPEESDPIYLFYWKSRYAFACIAGLASSPVLCKFCKKLASFVIFIFYSWSIPMSEKDIERPSIPITWLALASFNWFGVLPRDLVWPSGR